jgi:hypothetical protein
MDKYLRPDYDEANQKRKRDDEAPNFTNLQGNEEHISKVAPKDPPPFLPLPVWTGAYVA